MTLDLPLWPPSSVKVTFTLIIRWTSCCCCGCSIEFEMWTVGVWSKLKWRIKSPIQFFWNSKTNLPRAYLSTFRIPFWTVIRELKYKVGKLTENYEEKKRILCRGDLDLWPKITNFNRVWASVVSNHSVKTTSKSVHLFSWNFVHKTDRHIHRQAALQWKYNPSTILWRSLKKTDKEPLCPTNNTL